MSQKNLLSQQRKLIIPISYKERAKSASQQKNKPQNGINNSFNQLKLPYFSKKRLEKQFPIIKPQEDTKEIIDKQKSKVYQMKYEEKCFENTNLKIELNNMDQEKVLYKTKILSMNNEIIKLQKVIQQLNAALSSDFDNSNAKNQSIMLINEQSIITSLKSQLQEQQKLVSIKDDEINIIKRKSNYLLIKQFEIERNTYINEANRLKNYIANNFKKQKELKNNKKTSRLEKQLQDEIDSTRHNKESIQGKYKKLLKKLTESNDKIKTLEKVNKEQEEQIKEFKIKLEKNQQRQSVLFQIPGLKQKTGKKTFNSSLSALEDNNFKQLSKDDQIQVYRNCIMQKESVAEYNSKIMIDLRRQIELTKEQMKRQYDQHMIDLSQKQQTIDELDSKYKILLNQHNFLQQQSPNRGLKSMYSVNFSQDFEDINVNKSQNMKQQNQLNNLTIPILKSQQLKLSKSIQLNEESGKLQAKKEKQQKDNIFQQLIKQGSLSGEHPERIASVKIEDIKKVGAQLKYHFKLNRIDIQYILNNSLLTENIKQKGEASIQEIREILSKEPFEIKNEKDKLKLARFLVEDNTQEYRCLNLQEKINIESISSAFRNLCCQYRIPSFEEDLQLYQKTFNFINKFRNVLENGIKEKRHNKINEKMFENMILQIEPEVSSDILEYMKLSVMPYTHSLDELDVEKLLTDIYKVNDYGCLDKLRKNYSFQSQKFPVNQEKEEIREEIIDQRSQSNQKEGESMSIQEISQKCGKQSESSSSSKQNSFKFINQDFVQNFQNPEIQQKQTYAKVVSQLKDSLNQNEVSQEQQRHEQINEPPELILEKNNQADIQLVVENID